jgi:anti-sigma regulatory factor (Ser/Thr protein kinase)
VSVGRSFQTVLDAGPSAVGATRRAIARFLGGADEDIVDRVLLCTSELVTNALEHGGPPVEVRASVNDGLVRVEVTDGSERRPEVQHPGPDSTRGRGLMIVERCADRWGIVDQGPAKTVWCEIAEAAG